MPHGGAGRLIPIALDHPTIELAVAAVYPFDRRPPAKVRAFLDFLETADRSIATMGSIY